MEAPHHPPPPPHHHFPGGHGGPGHGHPPPPPPFGHPPPPPFGHPPPPPFGHPPPPPFGAPFPGGDHHHPHGHGGPPHGGPPPPPPHGHGGHGQGPPHPRPPPPPHGHMLSGPGPDAHGPGGSPPHHHHHHHPPPPPPPPPHHHHHHHQGPGPDAHGPGGGPPPHHPPGMGPHPHHHHHHHHHHPPPPPHHGRGGWGGHGMPPPPFAPGGGPMGMPGPRAPPGRGPPPGMMGMCPTRRAAPTINAAESGFTAYPAKAFTRGLDGETSPVVLGSDQAGSEKELRVRLRLKEDEETLYVLSNGVPNYQPRTTSGSMLTTSWVMVGRSRMGNEDRNPNTIREQDHVFYLPKKPRKDPEGSYRKIYETAFGGGVMWTPLGPMGVAVNGVPLYNEWAGPDRRDAVDLEAFDTCCGHPDPMSQYHYHQFPKCVHGGRALGVPLPEEEEEEVIEVTAPKEGEEATDVTTRKEGDEGKVVVAEGDDETGEPVLAAALVELVEKGGHSGIVGYAFDGFPIYGPVGWGPDKKSRVMRSSYQKEDADAPNGQAEQWMGTGAMHKFVDGSGDLDICNGCEGPTPEYPEGIYHYHCTIDPDKLKEGVVDPVYPYILARYRGVPDSRNFPPHMR